MKVCFKKRGEVLFFRFEVYCWFRVLLLLVCTFHFLYFFNSRPSSTDAQCWYGWQAGNRSVFPSEAEGTFISWKGHQFLPDGSAEGGTKRPPAQPAGITRCIHHLSLLRSNYLKVLLSFSCLIGVGASWGIYMCGKPCLILTYSNK